MNTFSLGAMSLSKHKFPPCRQAWLSPFLLDSREPFFGVRENLCTPLLPFKDPHLIEYTSNCSLAR